MKQKLTSNKERIESKIIEVQLKKKIQKNSKVKKAQKR
jgi:hypothetical protein